MKSLKITKGELESEEGQTT